MPLSLPDLNRHRLPRELTPQAVRAMIRRGAFSDCSTPTGVTVLDSIVGIKCGTFRALQQKRGAVEHG